VLPQAVDDLRLEVGVAVPGGDGHGLAPCVWWRWQLGQSGRPCGP
jgi:hypothetical protein